MTGVQTCALPIWTVTEFREELIVPVMSGAREVKQALTSLEGMVSRGEVEDFMVERILERSVLGTMTMHTFFSF